MVILTSPKNNDDNNASGHDNNLFQEFLVAEPRTEHILLLPHVLLRPPGSLVDLGKHQL